MSNYDGKLCRISKAMAVNDMPSHEDRSIYISQGDDRMELFTRTVFSNGSITANNYYDIIGMPTLYNNRYEIIVVSTDDVTETNINWVLSSIAVKTAPTKTSYVVGEYFNPSGLVLSTVEMDSEVNAITRNGNDVAYTASTEGFSFSPSLTTALTSSNTSVTITYNGKSTTLTIEITDPSTPTMDVTPADGTTLNWDDDEYGNGNAKTITVALNDAASGYNVNYSDPNNLWTVDDDEEGTITVYPNATNTSTTNDKELAITITHKDQSSLSATVSLLQSKKSTGVTDIITADMLDATTTSYTDFSNVSAQTDARYAGNSAKDSSGNIQLRSSGSNSGIVSTVSGGKVKSIKITVASGNKTIDVYGNKNAYTSAANLYATSGNNNQGTKIGSLTATGTITVSGDYNYVGIRSNSGAVYISSIEITWE